MQNLAKSVTFSKGTFLQQIAHPTHHTNMVAMRFSRHSPNEIFAKICTSWEGVQSDSFFVQFFGSAKAANPCSNGSPYYKSRRSFAIWALADTKGKTDVKVSKDEEVIAIFV